MAKETTIAPPQSAAELNVYVSSPNGPRPAKETTFREWVVSNQIGMHLEAVPGSCFVFFSFCSCDSLKPSTVFSLAIEGGLGGPECNGSDKGTCCRLFTPSLVSGD